MCYHTTDEQITHGGRVSIAEQPINTESAVEPTNDRRSLLKRGAVAAVVGAATAATLSQGRVRAGNGDTMRVGETNTASDTTKIEGGSTLQVDDGNSAADSSIYGRRTGSVSGGYGVRGQHTGSSGTGVYGDATSSSGIGVYGKATSSSGSGVGVKAESDSSSGIGLQAIAANVGVASTAATGVRSIATGTNGKGITSAADGANGIGVEASGGATGVIARGGANDLLVDQSGRVRFTKAASPAPTSTANGAVGTLARDSSGSIWYCYGANQWMLLSGAATAGALIAIAPARVYDSRPGFEPNGVTKGAISPGQNRVVDCTVNASGVPAAARAVVLNLTAANTAGRGNLAVYPDGTPPPATSSINYTAGVNIANSTTSGCGPGAKVRVQCGGSAGCDFIIDIVGYYL